MASGPITSWQIDGETMETVTDFILGSSKITADGDYSHKIQRCLLLGRKAMTDPDSVLKSRDITWPIKVHIFKVRVFPSDLEPVCCSMSSSNCCLLTCIQISQEAGQVVSYSHLFKNFPQFFVIYTVRGFNVVNETEIFVFLEISSFF